MDAFDCDFRRGWRQKSLVLLNVDDELWKRFNSTPDNYTVIIFNLSGPCSPLYTHTVQLAKRYDHMHLSVCLCTANDNDGCVHLRVCT